MSVATEARGWASPWTTHRICIPDLCSRRHTYFPSNLQSSSVLMLHLSSPTWLSCLTETVVPLLLLGLVPYHGVHRGPTGLNPVPPCSHWEGGWRCCHSHHNGAAPRVGSGMHEAWGTGAAITALPTLRKRKSGLPLTSMCLLSAHDSHHCRIQGTLWSRVAWMLIKLMPAFMCLADKAGWQCSKFRLIRSSLRRQTQTEPCWGILWQHLCSQNGIGPWQMGWGSSAGQTCKGSTVVLCQ